MPAVKKVSREEIIDAAVDVLRDGGFSSINARSVAKKLGCSTQPIYLSFKNMGELKAALSKRAIEMHTKHVRDSLRAHEGNYSRYSSYGMGFVKFAAEEKQLFRWLYLEGEQFGQYQKDVLLSEIIEVIMDEFGYSEDVARRFHQDMIYFSYGLAILANTDHLDLTEAELQEAFRREFRALITIYGKPTKLPEFAAKWVLCPACGAKTRLRILQITVLRNFPLFCPKCRKESVINVQNFQIEKIDQPGGNQ